MLIYIIVLICKTKQHMQTHTHTFPTLYIYIYIYCLYTFIAFINTFTHLDHCEEYTMLNIFYLKCERRNNKNGIYFEI